MIKNKMRKEKEVRKMHIHSEKTKNSLLQTEEFVVCPNCGKPILKASLLDIKGAANGKNYCSNCHFEIGLCFKGTRAAENAGNVEKNSVFYENALGSM